MSLPLPNLTDLKCAVRASGVSTAGAAIAGAVASAVVSYIFPPVGVALAAAKLTATGAGGVSAGMVLPLSAAAQYGNCQEQSNEAYRRKVAHQKEIGYCKSLEEGKVVVATLPGGRPLTLSEAAYLNQLPTQYANDYDDCVKKGHIAQSFQPQLPAPAPKTMTKSTQTDIDCIADCIAGCTAPPTAPPTAPATAPPTAPPTAVGG